jgi:predicted Zn-dependent peptidase/predicted Ser/Thr protein kinase
MAPVQATALPPRYEMLSELGRGGMGIVYKVRDRETGEVVALKILKPEIAGNPQILERFKNELLLAHKITHRRVARLYEFHRAGDAVYLSMEYVEGESLRSLLEREGRLETGRAIEFARQLADGLAEAHRQSIVHRDLKPENIMIAPDGGLKVMDFGISRSFAGEATMTGSVVGTPAYMAPEQAEGKALDHRVDIYAYGLTLYEMFTGEATFHGDTAVELALKQVRERPTNPTKLTPTLPRRVDAAIMKCLEKDPAKRFQSVEEAFQALAGVTAPDGPKVAKTVPFAQIAKVATAGRRKSMWAALGAVAAIAAIAAAGIWWYSRPSDSVVFPLEKFTLANGLKVVLSPDRSSPTFTLAVTYLAGSRRDTPGHAGLAHLVEQAMFEGSPNVARGEYKDLIGATGGNSNSGTSADASVFNTTLPSNQLELALFLEADRMGGLALTQEGLDAARSGVLEQWATSMNSGYATARSRFDALVYDNFANQQNGFGTIEELNRATMDEVRQFYGTYYTPSNAGLALVGDFDSAKARERIKHYFESIPARPAPPAPDLREPGRTAEKRESFSEAGIPNPLLIVAWQIPKGLEPDWFALKGLGEVLGGTGLSRLQNALVKTAGVASSATVGLGESAGPNIMVAQVLLAPGKDPAQAERMVYQEIDRVAREGVSKEEMERLHTDSLRRRAFLLVTTAARAQIFSSFLTIYGKLEAVNDWERQVRRVGSDDLKRVARKYLTPANRTVLIVNPMKQGGKP